MNQGFCKGEAEVSREIGALFDLSVSELKDRWRSVYGTEPPARSSRKLLVSAIAYRMQERAFGGLKPSVRRLLEHASEDRASRRILRTRTVTRASAGTVLIRDWQGKSHHVTVLDRGVMYRKPERFGLPRWSPRCRIARPSCSRRLSPRWITFPVAD